MTVGHSMATRPLGRLSSKFRRLRFALHVRRYHELSYSSHGDPLAVLNYRHFPQEQDTIPPLGSSGFCRIEMLHAPMNPADVNTIQGKYPSPLGSKDAMGGSIRQSRYEKGSTVAGSEGLGVVTHVTDNSQLLEVGNIVTMAQGGLGTYRSSLWTPASNVIALERGQELWNTHGGSSSTLPQLGGTAIRLLRDFCTILPGDIVVQNAGNSGVGFMVSQLAQVLHDVSVVSIVRRGERTMQQWNELVHHLSANGKCALVVSEEELLSSRDALKEFKEQLRDLSPAGLLPSLGLNAVGGDSASLMQKCLHQGGTMVTYGGMSMRPVITSTSQLIFRDLRILGYWHSRWMVQNPLPARKRMLDELVNAILDKGVTCPPAQEFSLSEIQGALSFDASQSSEAVRQKVVFHCRE